MRDATVEELRELRDEAMKAAEWFIRSRETLNVHRERVSSSLSSGEISAWSDRLEKWRFICGQAAIESLDAADAWLRATTKGIDDDD